MRFPASICLYYCMPGSVRACAALHTRICCPAYAFMQRGVQSLLNENLLSGRSACPLLSIGIILLWTLVTYGRLSEIGCWQMEC